MIKTGMLSPFTRHRAARLSLEPFLLWSLIPLQPATGNIDLNYGEQWEDVVQGQDFSLPVVDGRGKLSAGQQLIIPIDPRACAHSGFTEF